MDSDKGTIDLEAPVFPPPPGQSSNFDNPPSLASIIIALEVIFVTISLASVLARVYVRSFVIKFWGIEDSKYISNKWRSMTTWLAHTAIIISAFIIIYVQDCGERLANLAKAFCMLAAAGTISHLAIYTESLKVGLGRHIWDIHLYTLNNPTNIRYLSSAGITYQWPIGFAKLSILFLYLRIFEVRRGLKITIWCRLVFVAFFYTGYMSVAAADIGICVGLAQADNAYCIFNEGALVLLASMINVITDFYILCLPITPLRRLYAQRRVALGTGSVFFSGFLACLASVGRLVNAAINIRSTDLLWTQGYNAWLSVVEKNIAITVAYAGIFPAF